MSETSTARRSSGSPARATRPAASSPSTTGRGGAGDDAEPLGQLAHPRPPARASEGPQRPGLAAFLGLILVDALIGAATPLL